MLRAIATIALTLCVCAACGGVAGPPAATGIDGPARTGGGSSSPTPAPSPAASPDLVSVLDVQCGAGAPVLASDRVQASANGVRFHVTAKAGWELGVDYPMGHEGVVLDAPDQQVVLAVAPGDVMIDCADPSGSGPATTPLRIEDPGGFYRPFTISDGVGKCVTQSNDYVQGARGKAAAPIPQARHLLLGLRAGDVVERAGYSTDTGKVRIVRGRKVIGHLDFEDDGHGGWLLADATLCAKLRAG